MQHITVGFDFTADNVLQACTNVADNIFLTVLLSRKLRRSLHIFAGNVFGGCD